MLKIAFAIPLMVLLACGSGDTNQETASTDGDLSPVSATGPNAAELEAVEAAIEDLEAAAFEIESCLGLVASREYADAVPICLDAAAIDPGNTEVQAALQEAQAEVAAAKEIAAALEESIDDNIATPRSMPPRP